MKTMSKLILATLFFLTTFANASGVKVTGVIKNAECNSKNGKGLVMVDIKKDDTITPTWFKIDSLELCSNTVTHQMFIFGPTAKIVALSADNTLNSDLHLAEFQLNDNGNIVSIEKTKLIHWKDFYDKGVSYKAIVYKDGMTNWMHGQTESLNIVTKPHETTGNLAKLELET